MSTNIFTPLSYNLTYNVLYFESFYWEIFVVKRGLFWPLFQMSEIVNVQTGQNQGSMVSHLKPLTFPETRRVEVVFSVLKSAGTQLL